MSLAAMAYVFQLSLPAHEKLLALCMADYADDLGESIFPSIESLEAKAGMGRSTVKRTVAKLLAQGVIERVAAATPVSPAFYRLCGLPESPTALPSGICHTTLRRAVVTTFERRCECCGAASESSELGPDGAPWQIVRLGVGARQTLYAPHTVTLACKACVLAKRATRDAGLRTFTQRQRHDAAQIGLPSIASPCVEGVQSEPSISTCEGVQSGPSPASEGVHSDSPRGFKLDREGVQPGPRSVIDPLLDPLEERTVAAPRRPAPDGPTADGCLSILTKLAHEGFDRYSHGGGPAAFDVTDHVKRRAATLRIPYDSATVGRAIDSALVQRRHSHRRTA